MKPAATQPAVGSRPVSRTPDVARAPGASQAPEVGFGKRLLGSLHFTGVFWYKLLNFGVRVVPDWAIATIIAIFTGFFALALQKVGRALGSNLEPVLGPCGWWRRQRRKLRTFWTFAWCLAERYECFATDRPLESTLEGRQHWDDALASGRGVLLVTAHIGHWETGALGASTRIDRPVHVVREEESDPKSQEFTQRLFDEKLGGQVTMHFVGDPMLGMKMLAALRRGEIVAVQGDRPRTGGRTHRAEIFGRPIELPVGPAALARSAGVPMLPVFIFRTGRLSTTSVFAPAIQLEPGPAPESLGRAVEILAQEIEGAIRRAPHQWFCFRELWPKGRKISRRD